MKKIKAWKMAARGNKFYKKLCPPCRDYLGRRIMGALKSKEQMRDEMWLYNQYQLARSKICKTCRTMIDEEDQKVIDGGCV